MPDHTAIMNALALSSASTARERTIDITTTGARSGAPRRIEIWFHHIRGHWYLSSTPARRNWYSNLIANPHFVFHLKNGPHADLRATAVPITDPAHKRPVIEYIVEDLNQPRNAANVHQPQHVEDWMTGSPLVEILFTDFPTSSQPADAKKP
ncbi:nitroreductase/quinone reductase family protein [Nocardia sp. A7]|uniref:nitroreductase/quinone reductase family protein n=1 Tax=Nocardia sp. A7 TaxID=2789274 RepID=UPI003978FC23